MGLNNQIGKLDRFVQLVEFTEGKGDFNEPVKTVNLVKQVWAQRLLKSSGEDWEEKVYSINKFDYVLHYDPDLAAKNLQKLAIVDGGKTYYITGVNPEFEGRGMFMLLNTKYDG